MTLAMFRKQAAAKFLRVDAPGALITITPPRSVAVFAVLALACAALALLASFGRAQMVATGRGVVRPNQPPIVLHAPFSGAVLALHRALREPGHAGEVLLVLDARAETAAHDRCAAEVVAERKELAALEQRRADWNQPAGRASEASMALVLISQIRAQREKASTAAQRCEALGAVVARSQVTFPVDAVVADLAVAAGAQVHEGDVLATLFPASARLVGYLALPERYRAEVAAGQRVQVKFDALPYDEVGAGHAHVARMLDALPSGAKIDAPDSASVFAEIALDEMPAGAGPPRPGMSFTGDVLTRRRRILSLLFGGSSNAD